MRAGTPAVQQGCSFARHVTRLHLRLTFSRVPPYRGEGPPIAAQALIPPDAGAWSPISTKGYKDKDDGSADGITKVVLKGSTENKAKALVKGAGAALPDLALPVDGPVTVQLRNSDSGVCWGAVYGTGQLIKNQTGLLKAKAQ